MEVIAVAVGAGLVLGVVTGGLPGRLLDTPFRLTPVLLVAVGGRVALEMGDVRWSETAASAALLGSLAGLGVFCIANIKIHAMPVVLVGVALNGIVIALNGGMPIDLDAVGSEAERERLAASPAFTPEGGATLAALGQTIPVPEPVNRPVSFGDLILGFGLADVVYRASKAPQRVSAPSRYARRSTHTLRVEGEASGVGAAGDDATEREQDTPVSPAPLPHQV